jgi:4-hydroxy-tetrahydrodipicolinate synthase
MFTGAITALATPFRDGEVDERGLRELVEFQIAQGIDGLVPCGSTGEAATLTDAEQALVMRIVVESARRRVPVIAGSGSNSTRRAIDLSKMATEAGVDGLLHVTPYYNRPTAPGLVAHFQAVAEATALPILIYNVPSRTGCDIQPETVARVAKIPRIVGIKEATGSIARAEQILALCLEGFVLLSGDDPTCLACTALGGAGVISVVSNLAPGLTAKMIAAARAGRIEEARAIHYQLLPLMDQL